MSSTNKTPNLGLNSWVGPDKPKMADFNFDNNIVDESFASLMGAINSHSSSPVHITVTDRENIDKNKSNLDAHINSASIHTTQGEKDLFAGAAASISAHIASGNSHISQAEREKLAGLCKIKFTAYTGNGSEERKIALDNRASFGVIFALAENTVDIDNFNLVLSQKSAFFSEIGSSKNILYQDKLLTLTCKLFTDPTGNRLCLNDPGVQYAIAYAAYD